MSNSRELTSKLDRAQLYTIVEIAILIAGLIGTLITQQFWIALLALAGMVAFSRLVSNKPDRSIVAEVESDWSDD